MANSTRLVPPFSDTATDPADVYPLHNIIPEVEWKALGPSISPVIALGTGSRAKERQAIFPFKHSSWVNAHIGRIVQTEGRGGLEGKHGKKNLYVRAKQYLMSTEVITSGGYCIIFLLSSGFATSCNGAESKDWKRRQSLKSSKDCRESCLTAYFRGSQRRRGLLPSARSFHDLQRLSHRFT